jgi:hypothetical protein
MMRDSFLAAASLFRHRLKACAAVLAAAPALTPQPARAVVNPTLQPIHLYDRHRAVAAFRIAEIDDENVTFTLKRVRVIKGEYAAKEVRVRPANADVEEAFRQVVWEGTTVVAFAGKELAGHEDEVLFYPGEGWWQVGVRSEDGRTWRWTRQLQPHEPGDMFGTFNGHPDRLLEMMADRAAGRYYHPAVPFTRFREDVTVGELAGPVRGVALYDIDADGDLDVYACSAEGGRAFVQASPLRFEDATSRLGLDGVRAASVNFADVNGDGLADILLDGAIRLAERRGGSVVFRPSALLPARANENVKCAAFVEVNGDGWPDVVVAKHAGGLELYLNRLYLNRAGRAFEDASAAAGLRAKEAGAEKSGFFIPGDWNQDGRSDLFFAVEAGLFLVQGAGGRFSPAASRTRMDFKTGGEAQGLTGAGCFAALWRADSWDLICTSQANLNLLARVGGQVREVSGYGNEITECTSDMLALIAEDLNADGCVDVYAASRSAVPNMFYTNRGYGSFMTPHKYSDEAFPGRAHQGGAWGLAAGDANADGANDLLLGAPDGTVTLMVSDTLRLRRPKPRPTHHERKRLQTRIVSARVRGRRGVLGAEVRLADESGRVVARRVIGSNVATGCRGPDAVNLAVREPASYTLTVRFADGATRSWPVDLPAAGGRVVVEADRDAPPPARAGSTSTPPDAATRPSADPSAPPGRWWLYAAAAAAALAALLVLLLWRRPRRAAN